MSLGWYLLKFAALLNNQSLALLESEPRGKGRLHSLRKGRKDLIARHQYFTRKR